MKKIAITGCSGYYGRKLVAALRAAQPDVRILGLDISKPTDNAPDDFVEIDVRSGGLLDPVKAFKPDTLIHLAFIVNPMHDEALMHSINVDGTRNLLEVAGQVKPKRLLVASSATAYGAWPDNPLPIKESWPTRARREFLYAADKADLDHMVADFSSRNPGIKVSWTRPCIIYGPGVENYLSRMIVGQPATILADGYDLPIQFVHEQDVVDATILILQKNATGPFNVAPPDWVHMSDLARIMGKKIVKLPFAVMYGLAWTMWKLRLKDAEAPPGTLYFFKYPWVIRPERLIDELGYEFKYSTLQTFHAMLDSR